MGKEFLPLFLDFNETTQDLSDEQCGHLVRSLVDYANGKEPEICDGMELMAFRFLKGSIDRNARLSAVRASAGAKGGFAKAEKQKLANDSKSWQTVANDSKKVNINNDINSNTNIDSDNKTFLDDDDAAGIMADHNRVLDAAEDAGFKMTNNVRAELIALYADSGLEKMLAGINSCSEHGAMNLAYLRAVLKDSGKKAKMKILPAAQYEQRDYSGVQNSIMDEQQREIEEKLRRKAAGT